MFSSDDLEVRLTVKQKTAIEATMGGLIRYHGSPYIDEWGAWWVRKADEIEIVGIDYSGEEIVRWWADYSVRDGSQAGFESDTRLAYVSVDLSRRNLKEVSRWTS